MRTAIKYFDFEKYFFPEKIFLVAETEARLLSKSGNDWERVSEYLYYRGKSNQIVVGSRIYQSQVLEKKLAPPLKPIILGEDDTSNFIDYTDEDEEGEAREDVSLRMLTIFNEFWEI